MKTKFFILFAWLSLAAPVFAQGFGRTEPALEFTRNNPKFLSAFKSAIARPSVSTVRVISGGNQIALGVIVGPDGWILTKWDDLQDMKSPIGVRFRDGKAFDAELVGVHAPNDLALLKIDARGLIPIEFKDSKLADVGSWIACVGVTDEPVAVGVISVATRTVFNKGPSVSPAKMAFLGVTAEPIEGASAEITQILPDMPALKAGLKVDDVILLLAGMKVDGQQGLRDILAKFKPGDVVTLRVRRGDIELDKTAKLDKAGPNNSRGEQQNKMGSDLSNRRGGYSTILQHDSVVKPADCGGPIVDLDGRVLGINISRAGRVESWAVPSEVIQPILLEMMSGKLAPPKADPLAKFSPEERVAQAKAAVVKAERDMSRFEKDIEEARRALQVAEAEYKAFRHTDSAESAERILSLMQERLLTMNAVAGWKWNHRQEIFDADRERESLVKLQRRAKELKIDPKVVERFFKAQMAAARVLQEERVAEWQKDNQAAVVNEDLNKDLRPQIDLLNDELLTLLAKVNGYWNDSELSVRERIRQRSMPMVAGQGITPAIRAKALEGLMSP